MGAGESARRRSRTQHRTRVTRNRASQAAQERIRANHQYVLRHLVRARPWPDWWEWDLDLTPHLLKRMEDRNFTELDLRGMLQHAKTYRKDVVEERWVIESRHDMQRWEVIVEPDPVEQLLVVITAYPVSG